MFPCDEMLIGANTVNVMSVQTYSYEPEFAPPGKTILQTSIKQTEIDYNDWEILYKDSVVYRCEKRKGQ